MISMTSCGTNVCGETVAALEARALAARSVDAAAGKMLGEIAEDERRHGELAWQFVMGARRPRRTSAKQLTRL
jgi:hypothetical protein